MSPTERWIEQHGFKIKLATFIVVTVSIMTMTWTASRIFHKIEQNSFDISSQSSIVREIEGHMLEVDKKLILVLYKLGIDEDRFDSGPPSGELESLERSGLSSSSTGG